MFALEKKLDTKIDYCQEVTQISSVQKAFSIAGRNTSLERVFHCIYKLYKKKFIEWITNLYGQCFDKEVSIELAKEAFQSGVIKFYEIVKERGLEPNAKLETIINAFCKWKFLGLRTQKQREQKRNQPYNENDWLEKENNNTSLMEEAIESDEISWGSVIKLWMTEEEYILHQAIEMLPSDKWKKVIRKRYLYEKTIAEIAVEMKVSEADIYNTLTKARKALEKILITIFNFLKKR